MLSSVQLDENTDSLSVEQRDPTFDAVCVLREMELEQVMWGRHSNHEVVTSCTVLNWDRFPFVYDQFRARINAERKENYRWHMGWVLPGRGVTRVLPDMACGACGVVFRPASSRDKFCSQKCSASRFVKTLPCKTCGTLFRLLDRPNTRNGYCSRECGDKSKAKVLIAFNGKTQSLSEWARELGISYKAMANRRALGWSVKQMLTTPMKIYKQRGDE